jgi:hypothetical protein
MPVRAYLKQIAVALALTALVLAATGEWKVWVL